MGEMHDRARDPRGRYGLPLGSYTLVRPKHITPYDGIGPVQQRILSLCDVPRSPAALCTATAYEPEVAAEAINAALADGLLEARSALDSPCVPLPSRARLPGDRREWSRTGEVPTLTSTQVVEALEPEEPVDPMAETLT